MKQYWSATVYDRATHALIRDMPRAEPLVAKPGLQNERRRLGRRLLRPQGAGGQGGELGADRRRAGRFEVLFRFYGPEKPLFDKTWVLPDIERIAVDERGAKTMKAFAS